MEEFKISVKEAIAMNMNVGKSVYIFHTLGDNTNEIMTEIRVRKKGQVSGTVHPWTNRSSIPQYRIRFWKCEYGRI